MRRRFHLRIKAYAGSASACGNNTIRECFRGCSCLRRHRPILVASLLPRALVRSRSQSLDVWTARPSHAVDLARSLWVGSNSNLVLNRAACCFGLSALTSAAPRGPTRSGADRPALRIDGWPTKSRRLLLSSSGMAPRPPPGSSRCSACTGMSSVRFGRPWARRTRAPGAD